MPTDVDAGAVDASAVDATNTVAATAADASQVDQGADVADSAVDASDAQADAGADGAADQGDGDAPKPNQKKTVEKLTGRIGHLTRTLHQKDEDLAAERRKREALEALLNSGADADAPRSPPATGDAPRPGTPEFDALIQEEAQRYAAAEKFKADCNGIFDQGVKKHGETFKEAVTNLNALEMMTPALVQAAMATDSPEDVINALGADVEEAARISGLSPVQMGAEVFKLAAKLAQPKGAPAVSRAPPPISPVGSGTAASQDVYDPDISMEEYERRRAAQGFRFARTRQ